MNTCRSSLKPNKKDRKEEYITASGLRSRGWTAKLIADFAGEPDKLETNPVYKSAKPMKLYLLKRIKQIERTKKYQAAAEKTKKRKETAQKAAETKRQRTLDYAKSVRIKIPLFDRDTLIKRACKSYNDWHMQIDYFYEPATENSEFTFLSRICVNYLRHQCTRYDDNLEKMFGNVGVQEGHDILKERINNAIYEKYPWLKAA